MRSSSIFGVGVMMESDGTLNKVTELESLAQTKKKLKSKLKISLTPF